MKRGQRFTQIIQLRRVRQLHTYRGHVTIRNINAVTLRAYCHWSSLNSRINAVAQDLRRLRFDLLFFTADVRQNVVDNIE